MPINIVHGNLIEAEVDAIVNSADSSLQGGCGVDEAIHQAASPELLEECRRLGGCKTGRAKMTGAHSLPCKYIIHTVVPTWRGGFLGERRKLASCYRAALELALEHGCESIAFPLLGTGSRGYPKDKALRIARETIEAFFTRHDDCEMQVTLMIHNRADYQIDPKLSKKVTAYLSKHGLLSEPWKTPKTEISPPAEQQPPTPSQQPPMPSQQPPTPSQQPPMPSQQPPMPSQQLPTPFQQPPMPSQQPPMPSQQLPTPFQQLPTPFQQPGISPSAGGDTCTFFQEPGVFSSPMQEPTMVSAQAAPPFPLLEDRLSHLGDGFSGSLMRLIREKGIDHVECYKKANIDRKLFSRICCNPNYKPSKPTALAFAVALKLTLDETNTLLKSAGLALSSAQVFDVIVEFFISQGCFDIFTINEVLADYDQLLLGGL